MVREMEEEDQELLAISIDRPRLNCDRNYRARVST